MKTCSRFLLPGNGKIKKLLNIGKIGPYRMHPFHSNLVNSNLVTLTQKGLYCPAGKFYIDPLQAVETAMITHAHSDHLRNGHQRYFCAAPGEGLAREKLSQKADVTAAPYAHPVEMGDVQISFHPAGHILGSAQIRIDDGRQVWVVSGDYKRSPDPTCMPFEVLPCDVFITEATFALPIYHWKPGIEVAREILAWWLANRRRKTTSLLFCYSLGKAQRILAELLQAMEQEKAEGSPDGSVFVSPAMAPLIQLYRQAGIAMLPTLLLPEAGYHSSEEVDYETALILAPPQVFDSRWIRRFKRYETGFASGWMHVRYTRHNRGYDRGFVISDHADWPELIRTIRETGARRILPMHGNTGVIIRYLIENNLFAEPIETIAS